MRSAEIPASTAEPPIAGAARAWREIDIAASAEDPARAARAYGKAPSRNLREGASTRKRPLLGGGVLLSHGLIRSTIGARGLNFRVRDGTGCASPAMAAGQQGAFSAGPPIRALGAAQRSKHLLAERGSPKHVTLAAPSRNKEGHGGEEELGRLVALG